MVVVQPLWVLTGVRTSLTCGGGVCLAGDEDSLEKSEVLAIIESTPELDMDLSNCRGTR